MTDNNAPEALPKSSGGKVLRFFQWIVFILLSLLVLIVLTPLQYRGLPGFPEILFWISFVCCTVLALTHLPTLFFRLGRRAKISGYLAILPIFIFSMVVVGQAVEAFHQTPAGKIQKAKQDAADALAAKDAAERAETQRILAEGEKTRADLEAYEEKIERCFSTFGHRLSALEDRVKSTLDNPGAFEHVETIAIVPDAAGYNVAMQFRAENGFGALRLATVKAKVDADRCDVVEVGSPEIAN
jgi:hypothetical protein